MLCAVLWWVERHDRIALVLCIVGLAAATAAYHELQMMHSATPAEYGEWLRWYNVSIFCALGGLLLFVHYYLGTGRLWLLWVIVLMRSLILVVNFSVDPNVNFREI